MEQTITMGKRIARLRKQAGMTQDALAQHLGVSPQAVSKWENDLSCPDISILPKLARILGITTDELLGEAPRAAAQEPETAEEPEEDDRPGIHVETSGDNQFDIHFDPPKGVGATFAFWVIGTGLLMLLGPVFGLQSIGFWNALLISGVVVFSVRSMRRGINFFNLMFFLGGCFTALSALSIIGITLDWNTVLPAMIVLFGLFLLLEQYRKKKYGRRRGFRFSGPDRAFSSDIRMDHGFLTYANAFGEDHYRVQAEEFAGGEIDVSFGEHELDFSGVERLAPNCHLTVNSSFGEITLLIPRRYRAELTLSKSFADADVHGAPDSQPEGVMHISANLSFGELTIRYI